MVALSFVPRTMAPVGVTRETFSRGVKLPRVSELWRTHRFPDADSPWGWGSEREEKRVGAGDTKRRGHTGRPAGSQFPRTWECPFPQ